MRMAQLPRLDLVIVFTCPLTSAHIWVLKITCSMRFLLIWSTLKIKNTHFLRPQVKGATQLQCRICQKASVDRTRRRNPPRLDKAPAWQALPNSTLAPPKPWPTPGTQRKQDVLSLCLIASLSQYWRSQKLPRHQVCTRCFPGVGSVLGVETLDDPEANARP